MKRSLILGLAAGAALLAAGAAHAGNVQWSIGINLPPVATVISSGPAYYPEPVYYQEPRYYAPPPVVYRAPPVVYSPPVVYRPPVVVYRETHALSTEPRSTSDRGSRDIRWVPPGDAGIHVTTGGGADGDYGRPRSRPPSRPPRLSTGISSQRARA